MPPAEAAREAEPGAATPGPASVPPPRPLLASEALKDELAPVEPWRRTARYWSGALGAGFLLLAGLPHGLAALGVAVEHADWAVPDVLVGAATLFAAALPLKYIVRAAALVALSVAITLAGLAGFGPAKALAPAVGEWGLLHALAATGVPAALLFRTRYRAYSGARRILGAALALALPFVGYCVLALDTDALPVQLASGVAVLALASSLVGFMGAQARVAGDYVAGFIILAVAAQVASAALVAVAEPTAWELVWLGGSVAAFAGACVLGSLGVFQLLAARHWGRARRVDVHRGQEAPPTSEPSTSGWAIRP